MAKQTFDNAMQKIQLLIAWANKGQGYSQIAGIDRKFPESDDPVQLVFSTFGPSQVSLLEAVAYRPSITNGLGFLESRADTTFACTEAGKRLAEAFDEQVRASSHYEWLADITKLECCWSDVQELRQFLDVGTPSAIEQSAFLAQFFPEDSGSQRDSATRNRWLSINLVLRAVDAVVREKSPSGADLLAREDEIRAAMACGRTRDGFDFAIDGLLEVQAWWAVLQLRQLQRLAVDVLYCVVERWLARSSVEEGNSGIDDCAKAVGESALSWLNAEFQDKVRPMLKYFADSCEGQVSLYAASCMNPEVGDLDLFTHITDLKDQNALEFADEGSNVAVRNAYVALNFCAVEVSNLHANPAMKDVLLKDRDSCSLLSLAQLVQRMGSASPQELIAHLVKHWVVLRHFQIVADRSRSADGKNRFRFVVGDRGLERFDPTTRLPRPAFAQDRLQHILKLCSQAGLLEGVEAYRLSEYGRERVKRGVPII
jgi:hypothetical protein